MIRIDLQFFGGRGASSGGGGGTGGLSEADILETSSLMREGSDERIALVDETLDVFNDVYDEYGSVVTDIQLATLKEGSNALAYYDAEGNIAINEKFFDGAKMESAYADCVASGFHPSNGNKTAMQAVVAHELGHKLTADVGDKLGKSGFGSLDEVSKTVVSQAAKKQGTSVKSFRSKISGYASKSNAEAVAEAFSDVFCNGNKAKKESRAIVDVMNGYLKGAN